MNIYVGNLSYTATQDEIFDLFAAYGQVASVNIIKDKLTDKPRGFAFVEMPNQDEAQNAVQSLNGKDFKTRTLIVNLAHPREEGGLRRSDSGYDRRGSSDFQKRNRS